MTNLFKKLSVGVATAALLGASFATSAFAADVTVSGNGDGSTNIVTVKDTCSNSVHQSNSTTVTTTANVTANTGGNEVESNTGGSSSIETGNATAGASVTVDGGSNTATPASCCSCLEGGASDVNVTGNGDKTTNIVTSTKKQKTKVTQKNKTKVTTTVNVKAKTGHNEIEKNTGSGSDLTTGDAQSGVDVSVTAPSNSTP